MNAVTHCCFRSRKRSFRQNDWFGFRCDARSRFSVASITPAAPIAAVLEMKWMQKTAETVPMMMPRNVMDSTTPALRESSFFSAASAR